MAYTFNERLENFMNTHYDHVRRCKLLDGSTVIVFEKNGCFATMSNPCDLFSVAGLHVIKDSMDDFNNTDVFFIVDESENPFDSVEIVMEDKYKGMLAEQVKMERVYREVYAV